MNEEFKENLEVTETEEMVPEEAVNTQLQEEEAVEEHIPETVYAEPVIEVEPEVQPEAVMTQAEDGSWRHADNSPFSPFYVPDRKQKSNNRLTIGLVILLLLLLISGLIFAVSKLIEAAASEATVAWNESAGAMEEFLGGVKESFEKKDEQALEAEEETEEETKDGSDIQDSPDILLPEDEELPDSYQDYIEDFLRRYDKYYDGNGSGDAYGDWYDDDGYDDYEDYGYEDGYYEPSAEDDYYVELADALRDDLSYSVDFEEYTHSDYDNSVYISVWYAQVSDDLANSDTINECLMDSALYYAYMYESDHISDFMLEVESFVTYMDEETLSVVVDEYIYYGNDVKYNLYCMNFDLKTGSLLNNTDIIDVSDELVDAFIEQSIYQNGYTISVSDYSEEEIAAFMRDEDSLILFYTPVGLEIGYNHPNGWVTATLKDYQCFLKKL